MKKPKRKKRKGTRDLISSGSGGRAGGGAGGRARTGGRQTTGGPASLGLQDSVGLPYDLTHDESDDDASSVGVLRNPLAGQVGQIADEEGRRSSARASFIPSELRPSPGPHLHLHLSALQRHDITSPQVNADHAAPPRSFRIPVHSPSYRARPPSSAALVPGLAAVRGRAIGRHGRPP